MISSLDTYVYEEIKSKLDYIMKQENIINLSLANLDDEASKNFKETFINSDKPQEIEVSYQFPQVKQQVDARIVVQLGTASIEEESIGNVEGTYNFRETGLHREFSIIEPLDDETLGIRVNHPIGAVEGITEISFSETDQARVEGNYILFNRKHNEDLLVADGEDPNPITVIYTSKDDSEDKPVFGKKIGYTLSEVVQIVPISTNMDTLRCLDAIVRVILITMRANIEEQSTYLLQGHHAGEVENYVTEGGEVDRIIFSRPYTLRYTVSQSLDYDSTRIIEEINLKHKGGIRDDGK